jgi:hypothetical protein
MWLCSTKVPSVPPLEWASPTDMTGSYGATEVVCRPVSFGGQVGNPYSLVRSLIKIFEVIGEL